MTIAGPATIVRAAAIRDLIADAVAGPRAIEIAIDAEEIDFAVLQVLISASRSMRQQGAVLTLAHPPADPLRAMLADGGFTRNDSENRSWDVEVSQ